jgi:hypothetical protein
VTPRSPGSSRHPTPTPRKKTVQRKRLEYKHESIHTESVSSYVPSDFLLIFCSLFYFKLKTTIQGSTNYM